MIDSDKVKAQAKQIMDEFIGALGRIPDAGSGFGAERREQSREPSEACFPEFRERMFRNAPRKNQDFVLMEKKKW
ncbi:hypothetical protein HY640_02325 [Candidatus Woesearchaeota archaeon]|nr:hypothetical protein [Candidatus Woesearchaeota archaeon]